MENESDETQSVMNAKENLERLERKMKRIQSVSSQICVTFDATGRVVFVNQRFLELTGWEADDIIGRNWFETCVAPAMREDAQAVFFRHMAHDSNVDSFTCENDIMSCDGTLRSVAWTSILSRGAQGRIVDVTSLGVEVSGRKRRDDVLRISEERLRLAQKATNAVIWDLDIANGRFVWSEPGKVQFGSPESSDLAEFMEWWSGCLHPEDRERVVRSFEAFMDDPSLSKWHEQYRFLKSDGAYAHIIDQGYALRDRQGKSMRIIGAMQDITKRKRASKALRHEALRRKTLMQKSHDGIAIFDHEHRVVEANERFAQMLGYPLHEVVGLHTWDFEVDFTKEQVLALPLTPVNNKVIETRHRRKDGSIYDAEVSASSVLLWGEPVIFTISRDITARKMAEKELIEARQRAEAASRTKSEFLANMSHEIRTPLNGILGMLQLLQTTPLNGEQSSFISMAIQSNIRLTRLLSDILDLSRVEAGMIAMQNEPFSLRDVLSRVVELFRPAATLQDGVELVSRFDPHLPESVMGDSLRLSQVLTNLLGNAFKFTSTGFVTLEAHVLSPLKQGQARLYFCVADTGCGIRTDVLKNLFEPFTQGVQGYTRSFQGAGLGLSICKKLLRLMGGTISVETEVESGTTFHFSLSFPLGPAAHVPGMGESSAGPASGRILLAEDDPVNRFAVSRLLTKAGYQIAVAENGQEALALYEQEDFDVIIMDIQMPVLDGVEAARLIRAKEKTKGGPRTPIIALTSYAMKEDQDAFLAAGMDAHLAKPAGMDELRRVIDAVQKTYETVFSGGAARR